MNDIEKTILKIVRERHLVRKSELLDVLKNNGFANIHKEKIKEGISSLIKMNYIISICPIGEESYTITQEGMRTL